MISVLRSHVPHAQACILAGALRAAGFHADVWGQQAAHLYGELTSGGCSVVVQEDEQVEAEAFLSAQPNGEAPDSEIIPETAPCDGDPPGVSTLLYCSLWLALWAAGILTTVASCLLFLGLMMAGKLPDTMLHLPGAILMTFCQHVMTCGLNFALVAIGSGLLLRIIKGFRAGSKACLVLIRFIVGVTLIASLFCSVG